MPHLNGIRIKEYGPRCRYAHEQDLGELDDSSAIVPVGKPAEVNRKQKEWCPMADIREPGQNRRVELLKQKPVTDDVLDIVRHHREHGPDKEQAKVALMKRGEGNLFSRLVFFHLHTVISAREVRIIADLYKRCVLQGRTHAWPALRKMRELNCFR